MLQESLLHRYYLKSLVGDWAMSEREVHQNVRFETHYLDGLQMKRKTGWNLTTTSCSVSDDMLEENRKNVKSKVVRNNEIARQPRTGWTTENNGILRDILECIFYNYRLLNKTKRVYHRKTREFSIRLLILLCDNACDHAVNHIREKLNKML